MEILIIFISKLFQFLHTSKAKFLPFLTCWRQFLFIIFILLGQKIESQKKTRVTREEEHKGENKNHW